MSSETTIYPFEVPFEQVQESTDRYISAVFSCLESEFLVMPKGAGFVEYPIFEGGYEKLKQATSGFTDMSAPTLLQVASQTPISIVVLRAMLGFTPPEWAYVATRRTGIDVSQGFARTLDRRVRMDPLKPIRQNASSARRVEALIQTASHLLSEGAPVVREGQLHRLDKADTRSGEDSLRAIAMIGAPYAMLLYERFLGRPFAGHRDSVSELIGDSMESVIENILSNAGIGYRRTRRAKRIPGFDQAPDFIVPDEFNPQVVIEAKITEDDGTARDKVTRVQHLAEISLLNQPKDQPRFEVVACIGGRGFGVRREDMRKLLYATRGKVFTLKTLSNLIEHTRLKEFRSL